MASPVDTSVKFYTSLMDGAVKPNVAGVVGLLIAAFDACIAGFDSKSCTINVAGGVATVSWSGLHSCMTDSVVMIAGATGAWTDLNGEQKITAKTAGAASATFATALGNGAATGSITIAMAPMAYWTKVFSGTNLAVYRSTDPASYGMYLRIDDTSPQWVRVIGYETMSDVNTGVGPFPTNVQMAGGGYWYKSTATNANASGWAVFADSRALYFYVAPNLGTTPGNVTGILRMFGDPIALRVGGDPWAGLLNYSSNASSQSGYDAMLDFNNGTVQTAMPRPPTGLGSSILYISLPYSGVAASCSGTDAWMGAFPSSLDGILRVSKRFIGPTSSVGGVPRAEPPGLYTVPHTGCADSFKFGDRIIGAGAVAGKRFFALNPASTTISSVTNSGNSGVSLIDVVGPWR